MRGRLLIALAIATLFSGSVSMSHATLTAKGKIGPMSMTGEYIYWPDTWEPNCMTEDDQDYRTFTGFLSGSDSTTYRLCGLNTDGWTAGGLGLESDIVSAGAISDITITSPDGTGVHHAVFTGKDRYGYHYAVCYVPPYYLATDTGTAPLAGGNWTITLTGQISNATWTTRVDMTDVYFQQQHCPASEQNLIN